LGDAPALKRRHYLSREEESDIRQRYMTLIGLHAVEKFYGGRAVLRDLEMKVNPGARLGLIGGNGAGKSTLVRILAGLEEADAGRRSGAGT
jgi:ATPase subunit of ABC transporter with duplicated ATPase domains